MDDREWAYKVLKWVRCGVVALLAMCVTHTLLGSLFIGALIMVILGLTDELRSQY